MNHDAHIDTLVSMIPARPCWFMFFEDFDDPEHPFFAKPVEAWGLYTVEYPDDEMLNGTDSHAMIVDEETGMLTGDFVDAENFLGVLFSAKLKPNTLIEHGEIAQIRELLTRLETLQRERKEVQEIFPEREDLN